VQVARSAVQLNRLDERQIAATAAAGRYDPRDLLALDAGREGGVVKKVSGTPRRARPRRGGQAGADRGEESREAGDPERQEGGAPPRKVPAAAQGRPLALAAIPAARFSSSKPEMRTVTVKAETPRRAAEASSPSKKTSAPATTSPRPATRRISARMLDIASAAQGRVRS
jgi:hypothetical protein